MYYSKSIKILLLILLPQLSLIKVNAQVIKKIDGTTISTDSLQHKIEWLMHTAKVSGLCISILTNNKPVFSKAFGFANVPENKPLTASTILYGASFSKAVFAYIVMQLVQEKIIDPDKPLVQYLNKPLAAYTFTNPNKKGYQDLANDERYTKITARMCLSHTTGFPNWRWFEADKKLKIKFEPGSRYSYSGDGIYLLQFVVEQVTGIDLETMAQQRVFLPLAMNSSSYVWQEKYSGNLCLGHDANGEPHGFNKRTEANAGGSLSTTLDDYTKFFAALMQQKGINKVSFNEMTRPQVRISSRQQFGPDALVDVPDNDNIQLSYGLGYGVMKTPYGPAFFKEGHDDGWAHYSIGFPDKKTAVIIMTNSDNGESIFKALLSSAIGDTFTPWYWENYIPYDQKSE